MKTAATLVGLLTSHLRPSEGRENAVEHYHWLDVRADLLADLDPLNLRRNGTRLLLHTLRSVEEGGQSSLSKARRAQEIRAALAAYDFVTLEAQRDLTPEILAAIPPERRIISWRGRALTAAALEEHLGSLATVGARLYRFELACTNAVEALVALQFLHRVKRPDVTAYAEGSHGGWTRILAPRLGAPFAFGAIDDSFAGGIHGPTIKELVTDYGFPDVYPLREIFAIIGEPVRGSLSPYLHNSAYRAAGSGRLFLGISTDSFREFWDRAVFGNAMREIGLPILGLTIASPHKEMALEVASHRTALCRRCAASNLLVRQENGWNAFTTDPEGIFHNTTLGHPKAGQKVAIIGCGGSGRTAAAALSQAGADVTLVNRGQERGRWAAQLLGLPFTPLESFSPLGYSAIVHATPVGRNGEQLPVDLSELDPAATVVDLVYRRTGDTALIEQARHLGHHVVDGRQVLLAQARRQYYLMTGETMPAELGRDLPGFAAVARREIAPSAARDKSKERRPLATVQNGRQPC